VTSLTSRTSPGEKTLPFPIHVEDRGRTKVFDIFEAGTMSSARRVGIALAGAVKPRNGCPNCGEAPIGATHFALHHLCRPYRGSVLLEVCNRGFTALTLPTSFAVCKVLVVVGNPAAQSEGL